MAVNLIYSRYDLGFYPVVAEMKRLVQEAKKNPNIAQFTPQDDNEIGRGTSYAMFPELHASVTAGHHVSIEAFRACLNQRGVHDPAFQNKILNLILQSKSGIHYGLGALVIGLCHQHDLPVAGRPGYTATLDVLDNKSVDLVYKQELYLPSADSIGQEVSVEVRVNISEHAAAIRSFNVENLSDVSHPVYDFFMANQQHVFFQLITFIKNLLGFNSELRLEEKCRDDHSWVLVS